MSVLSSLSRGSAIASLGDTEKLLRVDRLPTERTLVVVGRSAKPSARATESLTKAELDAVSLTGGPTACQAPGLPIRNRRGEGVR